MPSPGDAGKRKNRHQRKRKEKQSGINVGNIAPEALNILTRSLRRIKEGWGMIVFTILVCLYLTDFYHLSSGSVAEESISVSERVRLSQPESSLLSKGSPSNTVTSLPGAIKNDGSKFDVDPNTPVKRDPNTLPGAIGLEGSFDENGADSMRGDEKPPEASGGSSKEKSTPTPTVPTSTKPATVVPAGGEKRNSAKSSATPGASSGTTVELKKENMASEATPSTSSRSTKKKRKRKKRKKKKKKTKLKGKSMRKKTARSAANGTSASPPTEKTSPAPEKGANSTKSSSMKESSRGSDSPKYEGPHPMSRQMEELQVAGGTGKLEESAIREIYGKLANAYLKPFAAGIKRRSFFEVLRRKTYSLTPPGANKGVQTILFQIVGGKLYLMDPYEVSKNAKPFYRSRIKELIWLLSEVSRDGKIPDTEFLLAIHDCVQTVSAEHTYRGAVYRESHPTFTIVSCNFSDNIPFPMWEGDEVRGGLKSWDEKMEKYKSSDDTTWNQKKEQAVFRGGNRPSMYFKEKKDADDHCDEVGRSRLSYIGKQHSDLFDVAISGKCGGVSHVLSHLSEAGHHKYKYILYAEGNCFWADRLNKQVFGPSAVIKQETPCGQFWEPLMKPMTHYIPTDFFFTDTVERINWAKQNDDKVQAIVKNANEFAANFLSVKSIKLYVEVLLIEYSKLLTSKTIKPERGSEEVTVGG